MGLVYLYGKAPPLPSAGRQDSKDIRLRSRIDRHRSGPSSKGRQHGIRRTKIKAGETKALSAHARELDAGMDMPRKIISLIHDAATGFVDDRVFNIVYKGKRPERQDTRIHLDRGLLIPILVQDIVITLDQLDPKMRKILAPLQKELQLLILAAVKKIAYYQQLPP